MHQTSSNFEALEALAIESFESLSPCEVELLKCAANGTMATSTSNNNQVRSKLLTWLCGDQQVAKLVSHKGVRIKGAKFDDELDLESTRLCFPLSLDSCTLEKGINLRDAESQRLEIHRCKCGPINAAGLRARSSVSFCFTEIKGELNLSNSIIEGELNCNRTRLINQYSIALNVERGEIKGNFLCGDGSRVFGQVWLDRAVINGNLNFSGGRFRRKLPADSRQPEWDEISIFAQMIRVEGIVFMSHRFRAFGKVHLVGAVIAGALQCEAGALASKRDTTLNAQLAHIGGGAYFGEKFTTNGVLDFTNCVISGGRFHFVDTKFVGRKQNGLEAVSTQIHGTFYWMYVKTTALTKLNLTHSHANEFLDEGLSWPAKNNLFLDGFTYDIIKPIAANNRLLWLERQNNQPFFPQPYEQLAKIMRQRGHESDAIMISVAREDRRRKYGGLNRWSQIWNWVLKVTIAHGYKPHRALVQSLFLIMAGWFLFDFGYSRSLMVPTRGEANAGGQINDETRFSDSRFVALIYSLDTFLPIVDLHQEANWHPNDSATCVVREKQLPCGFILRGYLWLQIMMGWLLTTLGVAAVTGLVRKD